MSSHRRLLPLAVGLVALPTLVGVVVAHPHAYPLQMLSPDVIVSYTLNLGHLTPDDQLRNRIDILDIATAQVSALYCQDLDEDAFCGEGPPPLQLEPRIRFCATLTLQAPFVPPPFPQGNWDPDHNVIILIDNPATGNPISGPCQTASFGTMGDVLHNP